ncbi:MAG: phenylalanine--tRNA ligase subunit beta, partial [Clostridia bacterium]|nr:phenylalanine--tRNA ligase subunit beta [Clostridia bacterium]
RVTSRKLGMRTESSGRFEKGMDPENTMPALLRACQLVQLLGAGQVVDGIIDVYPCKKSATVIPLEVDRINKFLGVHLSEQYMIDTLKSLEFGYEDGKVIVPSFRADVECMNDLAEEVIRIYGYNKIESTGFVAPMTQGGRNAKQQFTCDVTDALCGMGIDEINTFSFISPKYYDKIRMAENDPRRVSVKISNPLGEDTSVMRTTALPSILEALSYNFSQKNENVHLFEIATVYLPTTPDKLPTETARISMAFYDTSAKGAEPFYEMKGYVEAIMRLAGIPVKFVSETSDKAYHPGRCAKVMLGDTCLGIFGELHPQCAENYGFGCTVCAAELDFDAILENKKTVYEYSSLPKFPAVERDFSFVCDEALQAGDVEEIMVQAGGKTVESVKLFDVYRGPQIGEGKKSLSFAVMLRAADRTMTDEEADKVVNKIMKRLGDAFGITLRS